MGKAEVNFSGYGPLPPLVNQSALHIVDLNLNSFLYLLGKSKTDILLKRIGIGQYP
jgi:hypothetical protein